MHEYFVLYCQIYSRYQNSSPSLNIQISAPASEFPIAALPRCIQRPLLDISVPKHRDAKPDIHHPREPDHSPAAAAHWMYANYTCRTAHISNNYAFVFKLKFNWPHRMRLISERRTARYEFNMSAVNSFNWNGCGGSRFRFQLNFVILMLKLC